MIEKILPLLKKKKENMNLERGSFTRIFFKDSKSGFLCLYPFLPFAAGIILYKKILLS